MSAGLNVKVILCGAFKACVPGGEVTISIPADAIVLDLKVRLAGELESVCPAFNQQLSRVSAIGSEVQVLRDDDRLGSCSVFALLPPVCGG